MPMTKSDRKIVVIATHAFYSTFFVNLIRRLEPEDEIVVILFSDFIENELLGSLVFQQSLKIVNIKNHLKRGKIINSLRKTIPNYLSVEKIYIMPLLLSFLFCFFALKKIYILNLKKEKLKD